MKSLRLIKDNVKKGAASIYVVVFATILFGVITLSFTKIILSEASQSSDDDLSRSAYDTALAGVEDAKIMVNRYYDCLQKNGSASTACAEFNVFSDNDNCEDGTFPLAQKLHGIDGEVFIQESSGGSGDETTANQAYTCVLISDVTPDYRGTLTTDTRTKVIPININGANSTTEGSASNIKKIRFSWYSDLNQGSNNNTFSMRESSDKTLPDGSNATVPPTMQLTFIKTPQAIELANFSNPNNANDIVYSTMVFLPTKGADANAGKDALAVSHDDIIMAGTAYDGKGTVQHEPIPIVCRTDREFACIAELDIDTIITSSEDNILLIASLPYGDALTDFAVTLLDEKGNQINFKGAQISVDSTGRTNQLYRRVETRLEPADLFYPYPQYALEANSDGEDAIKKNFWVTTNCWTEKGACANNGELSSGYFASSIPATY